MFLNVYSMENSKRQVLFAGFSLAAALLIPVGGYAMRVAGAAFVKTSAATQQVGSTVKGVVKDQKGDPLIGVSVVVKGQRQGTVTDMDGNYVIKADPGQTLVFSYVGFTQKELKVGTGGVLDVSMSENAENLDELVVIGYGSVKKRDLTGSVAQLGNDKLKDRPYGNALSSMAGQLGGVNVTTTQGAPGMAPTVKVRGMSSINSGTTPLYVIDGIPLEDNTDSGDGANGGNVQIANRNPMNNINPNDIESIEVLKDASSAAIYGSRGANGVVIITTKTGQAGRTKIDVSYELGVSKVNRKIDMMNAPQWIEFETDARNNAYATALLSNPNLSRSSNMSSYYIPDEFSDQTWLDRIGNGTDWQDVLLRTATSHNIPVSASGGNERTQFMVSGN